MYILRRSAEICGEIGLRGFMKKSAMYPFTVLRAIFNLARLKNMAHDSPESLVEFVYDGYFGLLRPFQVRSELVELARLLKSFGPKAVVEIGTATGGTLYVFAKTASHDASIISVDLPFGKFGGGYAFWRIPVYKAFASEKQNMRLVRRDSHAQATLETVKRSLDGSMADILYIDADHSYEGVKKDYNMYSPLVRKGGLVIFHDISEQPGHIDCEVFRFWNEIKSCRKHLEISHEAGKAGGIGILYV